MTFSTNPLLPLINITVLPLVIFLLSSLPSPAQTTLEDSLLLYYQFNGNTLDESGNGNNAVLYGPTLTFDRLGNPNSAYEFDGVNDYIDTETKFDYEYRTISLWLNADDISGTGNNRKVFLNQSAPVLIYGAFSGLFENGVLKISPSGPGWTNSQVAINTWYHIVLVRDGATERYYLNNIELGQGFSGINSSFTYPYEKMVLGTSRHRDRMFFDGTIDDVRVYNRALNACEIDKLYTGDLTTFQTGPILGQPQPNQGEIKTYLLINNIGSSYLWTVIGGSVVSGGGSSNVNIKWGQSGAGSISVTEVDSTGCTGVASHLAIEIQECIGTFQTGSISGKTQAVEFQIEAYSIPEVTGSSFSWSINNGNVVAGNGTNSTNIQWGFIGHGLIEVVETDSFGCKGDSSMLNVTITTDNVEGLNEFSNHAWSIYPNPHDGQFELNITNPNKEIIEVSVIDMLGRRIINLKYHEMSIEENISLRKYGEGLYIVRITTDKITQSKKVIFHQ